MRAPFTVITVCVLLLPFVHCQKKGATELDLTFGDAGHGVVDFGGGQDEAFAMAMQENGFTVLAGRTSNTVGTDFAIARLDADGKLDTKFGDNGKVVTDFGGVEEQAYAVVVQKNGRILAAGSSRHGSTTFFALARYLPDGTLDPVFGPGKDGKFLTLVGSGFDEIRGIALQQDGRIVVAGYTRVGSSFDFAVARFTSAGAFDFDFSDDGKLVTPIGAGDDRAHAVVIQPDGKIVVAGYTTTDKGRDLALVRYETDGDIDLRFGDKGIAKLDLTPAGAGTQVPGVSLAKSDDSGFALARQPDGKLVVAGVSNYGAKDLISVARFNTDGSNDIAFNRGGKVSIAPEGDQTDLKTQKKPDENGNGTAQAVLVLPSGHILTAGSFIEGSDHDFALARITASGLVDLSFDRDGVVTTDFNKKPDEAFALLMQDDGRVIAAGRTFNGSNWDFGYVRYLR